MDEELAAPLRSRDRRGTEGAASDNFNRPAPKKSALRVTITEPMDSLHPRKSFREEKMAASVREQRDRQKDVGELFDDVSRKLAGAQGSYQLRIVFLVVLPLFLILSFVQNVIVFSMNSPANYWCHVAELNIHRQTDLNSSTSIVVNEKDREKLMPWDLFADPPGHSSCLMYDVNYTHLFLQNDRDFNKLVKYLNSSVKNNKTHSHTVTRCQHGWDYITLQHDASIVTEWNLVCDSESLLTIATVFTTIAGIIGLLTAGYIADRWGRKPTFFVFFAVMLVFSLSWAFVPTFAGFVCLAVLYSFGSQPLYHILYTIAVEMLTSKSRLRMAVWMSIFYAVGAMLFTLVAYFVRHWRTQSLYGTAPFFLIYVYVLFLPESPRWLLVHEKFEQVETYLRRVAATNGAQFDETCEAKLKMIFVQCQREVHLVQEDKDSFLRRASWTKLFLTVPMRRKTLLLTYLMITLQITYGGLRSFTPADELGGTDRYFAYFIGYLVEIPGYALALLVCDRYGRRVSILIFFLAAFVTCMITLAFPSKNAEYFWGIICVFFIARLFIAAAYVVGELLMYETFPTIIRLQGVAFVESISYIFWFLGPVIVDLKSHSEALPLVIFGCMALIAMVCVFVLPETVSTALPETVEEADMRGVLFRQAVNMRMPSMRYRSKKSSVDRSPVVSYTKKRGGSGGGGGYTDIPQRFKPQAEPAREANGAPAGRHARTIEEPDQSANAGAAPPVPLAYSDRPVGPSLVQVTELERARASLKHVRKRSPVPAARKPDVTADAKEDRVTPQKADFY
ncbi:hypothetical protein RvY_05890 [Ramazzottius varieornatus]|uniref:Major facilitator superfamily (MFS) profile domain-containing protein n=1 Tax=Ramazzottius varieornatus TaxID=947166 RepID=A0A1D1UWN0_RAMVA|nr:hypothetical protein RvY_05890 [Ramazzottius varieornatus]